MVRTYEGKGVRSPQNTPLPGAYNQAEPYIASSDLCDAVNLALHLRRPLLVEGEPGCGKTQLAFAVAYELGYPLKTCYIRSTSRAQDFLYNYDALRRLYDLEEIRAGNPNAKAKPRRAYVHLGDLGEAIKLSEEKELPSVVLIDEIDKADIDFPNDLLLVLDKLQFKVDEVDDEEDGMRYDALKGQTREARRDNLPFFVITSNREKELPKPFLRRCIYYYIDYPNKEELKEIVARHTQTTRNRLNPIAEVAVERFVDLRQKEIHWRKKPSTSEMLDWVQALAQLPPRREEKSLNFRELKNAPLGKLPYLGTLLKTKSDFDAIVKDT
ncbi:MAG: MoxR family ATPase [Chloroflexota bacterium]|nr:MoxR family ATPase [Chloroflexota bacterium]